MGLSETQRALLLRLETAQAGQPHAQALTGKETQSAQDLKVKGLLLRPAITYARLSSLGERLVLLLHGETFEVPREENKPPRPRRRSL